MENITCGLTRAELDAHQVGISQLTRDTMQLSILGSFVAPPAPPAPPAPAPGNYLHPVNFIGYFHRIFSISVFYLCLMNFI